MPAFFYLIHFITYPQRWSDTAFVTCRIRDATDTE